MRRGDDRLTLAERIQGAPLKLPEPPPVKPCWAHCREGRLPGLLIEWRRGQEGWEGRVVRPALDVSMRWVVVEEWLPAGLLEPG
jgi:hypothetical protein